MLVGVVILATPILQAEANPIQLCEKRGNWSYSFYAEATRAEHNLSGHPVQYFQFGDVNRSAPSIFKEKSWTYSEGHGSPKTAHHIWCSLKIHLILLKELCSLCNCFELAAKALIFGGCWLSLANFITFFVSLLSIFLHSLSSLRH